MQYQFRSYQPLKAVDRFFRKCLFLWYQLPIRQDQKSRLNDQALPGGVKHRPSIFSRYGRDQSMSANIPKAKMITMKKSQREINLTVISVKAFRAKVDSCSVNCGSGAVRLADKMSTCLLFEDWEENHSQSSHSTIRISRYGLF